MITITRSYLSSVNPRLHEQFLCGNCIWQFLFARVDDRQIFVFKLRQAILDETWANICSSSGYASLVQRRAQDVLYAWTNFPMGTHNASLV